jgi:hypothetical protein
MKSRWVGSVLLVMGVLVTGCAVRLGGPGPESFTAVALADAAGDPAALAAQLTGNGADIVLLSAPYDSATLAEVARQAQLTLSGPARAGNSNLALLSRLKILGDSALSLAAGAGRLHVMDALYEVDKNRHLDLMFMRMTDGTPAREAVRSLLSYYATDVGGTAAVLLALQATTPQAADSAALLLRSAFGTVLDCGAQTATPPTTTGSGTLRFFYGPQARIQCERGRLLTASPPAILGRVVVGR